MVYFVKFRKIAVNRVKIVMKIRLYVSFDEYGSES